MTVISPELSQTIEEIVVSDNKSPLQRYLARRALKKEVLSVEPLVHEDASFDKLGALAAHVRHDEEFLVTRVVEPELQDTAEILLMEIPEEGLAKKNSLGIKAVWASLEAWDVSRSDTTKALAVRALNSFWGDGQLRLRDAFISADKNGTAFDEELDKLNDLGSNQLTATTL